jgi:chorismate dehydratase
MIKVAAISYLNSIPFIYGLENSNIYSDIILSLDYPSRVADSLLNDKVDIALAPIVVLNELKDYNVVSEFCIGAESSVDSVCLYSNVPIEKIKTISLDNQSRTSVELLKLLLREYWNVNPILINALSNENFEIHDDRAALVIGDRSFILNGQYNYVYDLAEIWNLMTGLPFVFACWITTKKLSDNFLIDFNNALKYGVNNISKSLEVKSYKNNYVNHEDYLRTKISYNLNLRKKKAMQLFLKRIKI